MADLAITPANVVVYAGAQKESGIAGETIVAGKVLYRHTDGTLKLADDSTAAKAAAVGISLNGGAAGQPISYVRSGGLNPGGTVVVGTVYGVTDTPGGIGPLSDRAAADFVTVLGIGITASRINLAIQASGVAIPGA
jgi:hypothetical protein